MTSARRWPCHARSIEHYRRAIRLAPRAPELFEGVGWVLDWAGRTDEAIAEYRRAAALAPGSPSPHRLLAVAYERAGRHHEAIRALARAEACVRTLLAREPRNPWGTYLLSEIRKNL